MTARDDRAPLAKAYSLASRALTVALVMVVPGLLGYLLDQRLGTQVVFMFLGFVAGVGCGIWQLIQVGRPRLQDDDDDASGSGPEEG